MQHLLNKCLNYFLIVSQKKELSKKAIYLLGFLYSRFQNVFSLKQSVLNALQSKILDQYLYIP